MNNFKKSLNKKIVQSINNNYGTENYDEYRFGKPTIEPSKNLSNIVYNKRIIKNAIGYYPNKFKYTKIANDFVTNYETRLQKIWNQSTIDRKLFLSIVAYRILGYKKVKLPRNNKEYWDAIKLAKTLVSSEDQYDPQFLHFMLSKFDLTSIGYDIKLYFTEIGIAIDFILEQYAYKVDTKNSITVENSDIVLDVGGCWGDTALYFAHKIGDMGKVYSFEFIPNNIKIFNLNTSLNPILSKRIELIHHPIANISGDLIYYKDHGPGSTVELRPFDDQTGSAITLSIDDFVLQNKIAKVDFIKMDIEGAEPKALEGAIETIKRFKPKLAIAIYHSMEDFVNIPNWILDLNLGYEIFIDHFTIHAEETICFARIK